MEEVRRILFPVDLSEVSPRIASTALAMAGKFNAELHIVLVTEPFDQYAYYEGSAVSMAKLNREIRDAAENALQKFEKDYCAECSRTETAILHGDPAEEIINYVRAKDIDMVIMGTHGRKGLDRALFGSVAERVVRGAPVPVLTVNPYKRK